MGFFSHTHVAGEGRLLLFFFVLPKPGKHKIWPASYGPFGSLRVNLKRLRQMEKKGPRAIVCYGWSTYHLSRNSRPDEKRAYQTKPLVSLKKALYIKP